MKSAIRSRPLLGHQMSARLRRGARTSCGSSRPRSSRDHSPDFELMRRDDGVVARLGEVARLPVERLDEARRVVDHHRLLVRERELRIAVADLDLGRDQRLARLVVVARAVAPRRIEHHPDVDAALLRGQDRLQHRRIGEEEHPDPQRALRAVDRVDERLRGVVGQDYQRVGHGDEVRILRDGEAAAADRRQAWPGVAAGASNWMWWSSA